MANNEYSILIGSIFNIINKNKYPNLYKLYSLCMTFPISSSTCERSFSIIRKINNYLRSTMSDSKVSDLSLLSFKKDLI